MAAAIALSGGAGPEVAMGLWMVIAARSIAAVTFVRVQLRRAKGHEYQTWHGDLGQLLAVGVAITALLLSLVPALAIAAICFAALFNAVMLRRPPAATPVLGSQQIGVGLLVVFVTGLAVRAP